MKRIFTGHSRGQTLVWVALALTVLMGFVALAVDVGNLMAERRHMQNAADAAALEAARLKCFGSPQPVASNVAAQGGVTFANNNYGTRANAVSVTFTVVPRAGNEWEFDATAVERVRLSFGSALGITPVDVRANASAACGGSTAACGLYPLAFSQSIWNNIQNNCGQTFYVWTGDNDLGGGFGANPPNCTVCDCTKVYDNQNNLQPGVLAVADNGRAWLDFTSAGTDLNPVDCGGNNGCGASELACWLVNGSNVLVLNNACVSGTNGIKFGVKNPIATRAASPNNYVSVPLFDGRCTPSSPSGGVCDSEGFHLSGFGCVQVLPVPQGNGAIKSLAWRQTPTPPPNGGGNTTWCTSTNLPNNCKMCLSEKMIPVNVACNKCDTDCGRTTGGGNPGAGVRGVSLIGTTPTP